MPYATITPGVSWLAFYKERPSQYDVMPSIAEAEQFIDTTFAAWDRSHWSGPNVPPTVRSIAEKIASADFLYRRWMERNPDADRRENPSSELRRQAVEEAEQAVERGWVLAANGEPQYPIGQNGTYDLSVSGRVTR